MGGEVSHASWHESVEVVLEQFRAWLVQERGLAPESVRCYVTQARPFLVALPSPLDEALRGLGAGQVTAFMLGRCAGRNVWSAKAAVTAVRSLLRFLHLGGHVPVGLAGAVPSVAGWRLASLPRGLDAGQVELLLAACDPGSPVGRRDFAVLTVLARLGLRGAEVAGLRLVDVDWRAGELTVRGKANRIDALPLPVAVGEALVAYLTDGRPACDVATLFVTVRAPVAPAVAGRGAAGRGPGVPAGGAATAGGATCHPAKAAVNSATPAVTTVPAAVNSAGDMQPPPQGRRYGERLAELGAVPSIGSIGDSYDCDDPALLLLAV